MGEGVENCLCWSVETVFLARMMKSFLEDECLGPFNYEILALLVSQTFHALLLGSESDQNQ